MNSKKIGFFIRNFAGGGAEIVTINLANSFINKGYDVYMFVINTNGPYLNKISNNIHIVELTSKRLLSSVFTLKKALLDNKIQTLFSNMTHENLVAILATRSTNIELIGVEHNNIEREIKRRGKLNYIFTHLLVKFLYKKLRYLICVSSGVAEQFKERYKIPNVRVIHNPIESKNPDIESTFNEGSNYLLAVGRLTEQKNFQLLIRTYINLIKDGKYDGDLIIAGEGEESKKLIQIANDSGLANKIHFLGFVNDTATLYKNADLLVVTSLWEGFGNIIVEALLNGTKVVSTDCEYGPKEILENGKHGSLITEFNEDKLAEAITSELSTNRDCNILKKRGLDFSIDRITLQYMELIK